MTVHTHYIIVCDSPDACDRRCFSNVSQEELIQGADAQGWEHDSVRDLWYCPQHRRERDVKLKRVR